MDIISGNTTVDIASLNEKINRESAFVDVLTLELGKAIVGQKYMVERLLLALLSNGHILLEGVPGLAKTLAIKSLASAIHAKFSRIQFTPDLLPSDLTGTMIYNQKETNFVVKKGPIFANLVLADEINRAPAKVQAALLEAMQEKQVTIGDHTYKLEEPFLVPGHPKPHRTGRHLSFTGSAGRPFYVEGSSYLSEKRRGADDYQAKPGIIRCYP